MKLNPFKFILLISIIVTFSSCNWLDTNDAEVSSNPYLFH